MTMRALIIVFFALITGFTSQAIADPGHANKGPHAGSIREVEGIHAELVIDKFGRPKVFLYDTAMKPLERSDIQARLTAKGHDGAQYERDLKFSRDPKEGPMLKGETINGLRDWDTAVVSLKLKDSWTHLKFSHH